jgi:hypothetical protein
VITATRPSSIGRTCIAQATAARPQRWAPDRRSGRSGGHPPGGRARPAQPTGL